MTPKSRDLLRHSGESLQNGQLELRRRNWYFARETHKDTAVSVWACQAGFWKSTGTSCQLRSKPHAVFHRVCEIVLTEVLATQMGVMRRSKKVSSFELYKINPLSPHCGSIAREHCVDCTKSETSDSFVNNFDGHFAYLKTLDFYFNSQSRSTLFHCAQTTSAELSTSAGWQPQFHCVQTASQWLYLTVKFGQLINLVSLRTDHIYRAT